MPIAQYQLEDGSIAEFEIPKGMAADEVQRQLEPMVRELSAQRKAKRENIYNADRDAVISAPVGATADQINYHDDVDNLGGNKADYFGYIKPPVDFVAGAANMLATLPRIPALSLIQTGEILAEDDGNRSAWQVAKDSFKQRFAKAVLETGEAPSLLDGIGFAYGAQKDAFASLIMSKDAPKKLIDAGKAMLEQNQAARDFLGVSRDGETSFAYDVGNAMAQIGVIAITKSPRVAMAYMGAMTQTETYFESRQAGLTADESFKVAFANAYGAAQVELVGGKYFLDVAGGFSKKFLLRTAGQSTEEMAQATIEETILDVSEVRDTTLQDKIASIAYQGLVGAVAGAPVSAIYTKAEQQALQEGMSPDLAVDIAKNVSENRDVYIEEVAKAMKAEGDIIASDSSIGKESLTIKSEIVKAVESGDWSGVFDAGRKAGIPTDVIADTVKRVQAVEAKVKADEIAAAQEKIKPTDTGDTLVEGRIKKLDNDVAALDNQIDQLVKTIDERTALDKPNVANETKLNKLLEQREALDEERANLITTETPIAKQKVQAQTEDKAVTVKGSKIKNLAREGQKKAMSALNQGLTLGAKLAKQNTKQAQKLVIDIIKESDLTAADKAKFITTIKDVQTTDQLPLAIKKVNSRIMALMDKQSRRESIGRIKDIVSKAKNSESIAVDLANKIQDMVSEIDLTKRTDATINSLKSTLDYLERNPDAVVPNRVIEKLQILNKKSAEDISTDELSDLADTLENIFEQGRVKLKLFKAQKERIKQERLEQLKAQSKKIESVDLIAPDTIGGKIERMDRLKNKFIEAYNKASSKALTINPMDVVFDVLDNMSNYKGANYKIFKETIDKGWNRFINRRDAITAPIKELHDKYDFTEGDYEKIGAWAVLMQEGGEQRLLNSGFTKEQIDALVLDGKQAEMYQAMRKGLDSLLPDVKEVMRLTYNKNVDEVKDYFPFLTDFDKIAGFEIQDTLGDTEPLIAQRNVQRGFTKSRIGSKKAIRIDALGVFMKHVENATYLTEIGSDIKALGELAASKEYGDIVGDMPQEIVVDWINLLARKGHVDGRIPLLDVLRRNVGAAVLGFKLGTVFVQPTALADGAALVGGDYVSRGIYDVTKKEWREFLWKNMPELRERAGGDISFVDMGGDGLIKNAREASYWALKKVDMMTASSVLAGAYRKAVEAKGGVVDLANPDPDAIVEAQRLMRRTQASGLAKDAPMALSAGKMTGNVSVDQAIFQFQSFMFNRWSLYKHDMWQAGFKKGRTKEAVNVASWLVIAQGFELMARAAAVYVLYTALGSEAEDWDKDIDEKLIKTAVSQVPIVSQAVNSWKYQSSPIPILSYTGSILNELKWADMTKNPEKKAGHELRAAILASGALGVPGTLQATQIQKILTK